MLMLSSACKQSKELELLLKSPIVKTDKKLAILKQLFEDRLVNLSMSLCVFVWVAMCAVVCLIVCSLFCLCCTGVYLFVCLVGCLLGWCGVMWCGCLLGWLVG